MCVHILSESDTEIGVGIQLLASEHFSGVYERHLSSLGYDIDPRDTEIHEID